MLFDAIENGDVGTVWQQVQKGIRFDQIDLSTELTPLGLAAEAGHAEIVRILLSAGASPDLGGATTPLEAAVVGGHHEVVEALLRHDADVNKAVEEGFTPLMTAATTGDLELVQILLNAGARIQAKNDDGDTAATLAEDAGHLGVAVVLRARGSRKAPAADRDRSTNPRRQAPEETLVTTNSELAAIVRDTDRRTSKAPQEDPSAFPQTATSVAASVVPSVAAEAATEETTSSEVPDETARVAVFDDAPEEDAHEGLPGPGVEYPSQGEHLVDTEPLPSPAPPLVVEAEEEAALGQIGSAELQEVLHRLRALCAQGIGRAEKALRDGDLNPQLADHQGYTLLMAAAHAGEVEMVRLLLAVGADTAQTDTTDDGFCALVWAIRSPSEQRVEVLKTLVEAGADPNQRCGLNRRTPLMFAAQADVYLDRPEGPSFASTTRSLVELGADLEARDRRGLTVWRLIKRDALGAPTFGSSRRRLHHMVRVLEHCGAEPIESHAV